MTDQALFDYTMNIEGVTYAPEHGFCLVVRLANRPDTPRFNMVVPHIHNYYQGIAQEKGVEVAIAQMAKDILNFPP